MPYVVRELEAQVARAARDFPAVVLTGPRRAGKTSLLVHLFPRAAYHLIEDSDVVERLRADPHGFLDQVETPAILDELQSVPDVLSHVRARIDRQPRKAGQWLLTASREAPLMQGVSESMAGRAAVLSLLPFSTRESEKVSLFRGGYPEALARPSAARLWFSSYIQTYLERDVRAVTSVRDLPTFRRFMALVASRHGQVLNKSDLAGPLGVSVPTITQWLNVLETTAQILLIQPFYENLGKRLTRSPRLYVADSGLACHLLGLESAADVARSPFRGALFEGFIASEIVKAQANSGRRRELYFFRDQQGLEVDFVLPRPGGGLTLVECKAGKTVFPHDARPILRLAEAVRKHRPPGTRLELCVVHEPRPGSAVTSALAPGVRALPWPDFVAGL
jgi:hypothetical protein